MSYTVFLHPQVIKFLKKIPEEDVKRIKVKLSELVNPYSVKASKLRGHEDTFRIRVGDYRILYTVNDQKKVVVVFKIDKRGRISSEFSMTSPQNIRQNLNKPRLAHFQHL